jgi:hypothetical protein
MKAKFNNANGMLQYRLLEDTEISDYPWLEGKTHSLEVGNRPETYILEVEEEEGFNLSNTFFHKECQVNICNHFLFPSSKPVTRQGSNRVRHDYKYRVLPLH